jgi:hypothetical protein
MRTNKPRLQQEINYMLEPGRDPLTSFLCDETSELKCLLGRAIEDFVITLKPNQPPNKECHGIKALSTTLVDLLTTS